MIAAALSLFHVSATTHDGDTMSLLVRARSAPAAVGYWSHYYGTDLFDLNTMVTVGLLDDDPSREGPIPW